MFITSHHRAYWQNLLSDHPEELDENGTDISTIRQNRLLGSLSAASRQMRIITAEDSLRNYFRMIASELRGALALQKRLKAAYDDDYVDRQE